VFFTCTTHAFTTETEEVMGLLLGDIQERPGVGLVARIWIAMPQIRTDRRKVAPSAPALPAHLPRSPRPAWPLCLQPAPGSAAAPAHILRPPLPAQDRVETSPEQMARSSEIAARFTNITGIRTRVIGWYHSHPHITVRGVARRRRQLQPA
jgi:BRCA1/BRCA2-containing complex subunit 3